MEGGGINYGGIVRLGIDMWCNVNSGGILIKLMHGPPWGLITWGYCETGKASSFLRIWCKW